jgi:hypothetical protein
MIKMTFLRFQQNLLLLILTTMIWSFGSTTASAQSGGLQLLGIGPDAVTLSLSESVTARRSYGASIFMNPANLAGTETLVAGASHTFWLETSGNTYFSVLTPSRYGVFGLGVLTSSVGNIEARQTPGAPIGTFDVSYYAFAGSFAREFGFLSIGATGMFLYEELYNLWATGYAFNAGVTGSFMDDRLRVGTTLLNNGKMDYLAESRSPLPTMWKSGAWSQILQLSTIGSSEIPLIAALSIDLTVPLNDEGASDGATTLTDPWVSFGLEATISDLISIRGGLRTGDTKRRFSTGIGISQGDFGFDYSYVPFETGFGVTHSLSITYRL